MDSSILEGSAMKDKAYDRHASVLTFTELERALEELVHEARLAGLEIRDLIALLEAGLGVKEILEFVETWKEPRDF
jgi:hypothetical protein